MCADFPFQRFFVAIKGTYLSKLAPAFYAGLGGVMSSLRRIRASQANGARSSGPVTAQGKRISSQNAISHGLLARQVVMGDESPEGFQAVLDDHLGRLQPADGVEFGMVEEMVASHWRLRRAWALETRMLENEAATQSSGDALDRMTNAFVDLAAKPSLGLMHRYQTRLHLNYQRALHNMLLLRAATVPNEPSPISEHEHTLTLDQPQPDPETVAGCTE
jgi:hypothetical protein